MCVCVCVCVCLAFRDTDSSYRSVSGLSQVYVTLVDATLSTPVVLSPTLVSAGTTNGVGLSVFSAVVQPDRLAIVYGDSYGQPWLYDVGVTSGSFVLGR